MRRRTILRSVNALLLLVLGIWSLPAVFDDNVRCQLRTAENTWEGGQTVLASIGSLAGITARPAANDCKDPGTCDCDWNFFGGCSNDCDRCGETGERKECNRSLFSCACDCVH